MPPPPPSTDLVDLGSREHYADAALYDYEYRRRREDVRFYRGLARELAGADADLLELACGSGRITAALARDRHRVVGFDLSPEMLAQARARIGKLGRAARARVSLFRGDARLFAVDRRFPLAIMAFNSFEHLYTRVEVAACLARVREHLAPGGRFAFDVQLPDLRWLARDPRKRWARTVFRHPDSGQQLQYTTNHDYDPISQIVVIRLYYEPVEPGPLTEPQVIHLSQRKFFPAELEALVAGAGFAVERRYGDFDGSPLDGDAGTQVLVCRVR